MVGIEARLAGSTETGAEGLDTSTGNSFRKHINGNTKE
jgi:hypothetical protein